MERRTRGIPVARFRTQEAKTRSRSRVRDPDYNEQDPEHDMFTLLEDNIALREENKTLKLEIEAHKNQQNELSARNEQVGAELSTLQTAQKELEAQLKELNFKQTKLQSERNASEKLRQMKAEEVNTLALELDLLRRQLQKKPTATRPAPLLGSVELKHDLLKILPVLGSNTNDMDSILEVDDSLVGVHITSELVERLVAEFLTLKQSLNAVELQLYEANEKISELLEHQHQLEEENETLRTENTNLTKVAKLLTENMKESVETSKKMEAALIKLKLRNDELVAAKAQKDHIDGQPAPSASPPTLKANAGFEEVKEEVQQQTYEHNERIVEMQSLMDAAIEKTTNDELKKLQLKLEVLEEQLRQTVVRAELAESALENYKANGPFTMNPSLMLTAAAPKSPPPPPPLPAKLLYQAPKPPAEVTLRVDIAAHNLLKSGGNAGAGGCGAGVGNKIIDNAKQQVQAEAATGLDAIVREFKSGRVTLRRNRRKTHTNEALQEMFHVLEISQKQNRNSKICVNMHL